MKLRVVGLDPSLTNWGYTHGQYNTDTDVIDIDGVGVFSPVASGGKQVRQNSKDLERAHELSKGVFTLVELVQPHSIFIEVPVGSQSARAMASYGICIGIIAALKATTAYSIFEVTPTEVKIAAVGNKTATKQQMIEWATTTYPTAKWPTNKRSGITSIVAGKAEHMADAIGAIHAGLYGSSEFTKYLQTLKQFTQESTNAS